MSVHRAQFVRLLARYCFTSPSDLRFSRHSLANMEEPGMNLPLIKIEHNILLRIQLVALLE